MNTKPPNYVSSATCSIHSISYYWKRFSNIDGNEYLFDVSFDELHEQSNTIVLWFQVQPNRAVNILYQNGKYSFIEPEFVVGFGDSGWRINRRRVLAVQERKWLQRIRKCMKHSI